MNRELEQHIEELESKGFIVILKWDGERSKKKRTVLISSSKSDSSFRKDTDNIELTLLEAIEWANSI